MRFLAVTLLSLFVVTPFAQAADDESQFLRIGRDSRGRAMTLDTAITRYKLSPQDQITPAPDGADQMVPESVTVDLIGAVHVGNSDYYRRLNAQFEEYDVLLYELVGPKGSRPQGKTSGKNPAHILQDIIKTFLGLDHQLSEIDYNKDNFVHADLGPAELLKKMNDRGDTFFTIFLTTMADSMRQENLKKKGGQFQNPKDIITDEEVLAGLLEAMITERGSPVLRRFMALQIGEDPKSQAKVFGGPLGQLLIQDRNVAAMKVLKEQMEKGETKISIFYGAGHLPDFETRLKKLGFKKTKETWLTAWDLR